MSTPGFASLWAFCSLLCSPALLTRYQIFPAVLSDDSIVLRGSSSDNGVSSKGMTPNVAYQAATFSFFASIRTATPPRSLHCYRCPATMAEAGDRRVARPTCGTHGKRRRSYGKATCQKCCSEDLRMLSVKTPYSCRHEETLDETQESGNSCPAKEQIENAQAIPAQVEMMCAKAAQNERQQHTSRFIPQIRIYVGKKDSSLLVTWNHDSRLSHGSFPSLRSA